MAEIRLQDVKKSYTTGVPVIHGVTTTIADDRMHHRVPAASRFGQRGRVEDVGLLPRRQRKTRHAGEAVGAAHDRTHIVRAAEHPLLHQAGADESGTSEHRDLHGHAASTSWWARTDSSGSK